MPKTVRDSVLDIKSKYCVQGSQFYPKTHPALPELDILENPTLQVRFSYLMKKNFFLVFRTIFFLKGSVFENGTARNEPDLNKVLLSFLSDAKENLF